MTETPTGFQPKEIKKSQEAKPPDRISKLREPRPNDPREQVNFMIIEKGPAMDTITDKTQIVGDPREMKKWMKAMKYRKSVHLSAVTTTENDEAVAWMRSDTGTPTDKSKEYGVSEEDLRYKRIMGEDLNENQLSVTEITPAPSPIASKELMSSALFDECERIDALDRIKYPNGEKRRVIVVFEDAGSENQVSMDSEEVLGNCGFECVSGKVNYDENERIFEGNRRVPAPPDTNVFRLDWAQFDRMKAERAAKNAPLQTPVALGQTLRAIAGQVR